MIDLQGQLTDLAQRQILVHNPVFARALNHKRSRITTPSTKLRMINLDMGTGSVGYYRTSIPFYYLQKMGFAYTFTKEGLYDGPDPQKALAEWMRGVEWANIIQVNRPWNSQTIAFMKSVSKRGKLVVLDTDDNLEAVASTGHTGLKKFWTKARRSFYVQGLEVADVIGVASKYLHDLYSERWPEKTIYLPNPVDTNSGRWNFPHKKTTGPSVKICWYAGASHLLDGAMLEKPVREILHRYPKVKFKVVGYMPEWLDHVSKKRLILAQGEPYHDFVRNLHDVDIVLAPLIGHSFNLGRSDTKIFEPTMAGCAVIASDTGEYRQWEGRALLAKTEEDWVDSMTSLIEAPDMRQELNSKAMTYLLDERAAESVIPIWYDQLNTALRLKLGE